jgi:O-antigen ligase
MALFFTAGRVLNDEARFRRFAAFFLAAVAVPVLLGLLQLAGVLPYEYFEWSGAGMTGRVSGTYQHPLGLIYFVAYAIPLALYLLDRSRARPAQVIPLLLLIACALVGVVFAYHRAALVVLAMQLCLWQFLTSRWKRLTVVAGLIAMLVVAFSDALLSLFSGMEAMLRGEQALFGVEAFRGRGVVWRLFLGSLFDSHPLYWFIGKGGSFAEGWVPGAGFWSSIEPHNDFIRILNAYGLIGLGLYLAILWRMLRQALSLRRSADAFSRTIGNLLITSLAAIGLLSVTSEPTRYPTVAWYLFTLASVAEVRSRAHRRTLAEGKRESPVSLRVADTIGESR